MWPAPENAWHDLRPLSWNWTYICPTGLTPWLPDKNYLTPCFQQLCLQLPILLLFAIVSAYHFGRQAYLVARNNTQIRALYLRIWAVFALGFLPVIKTYSMITDGNQIWPSDILVVCTESVTWIVHLGKGTTSPTGCLRKLTILFLPKDFCCHCEVMVESVIGDLCLLVYCGSRYFCSLVFG